MTYKALNDDMLLCSFSGRLGDASLRPKVNIHTVWNAND